MTKRQLVGGRKLMSLRRNWWRQVGEKARSQRGQKPTAAAPSRPEKAGLRMGSKNPLHRSAQSKDSKSTAVSCVQYEANMKASSLAIFSWRVFTQKEKFVSSFSQWLERVENGLTCPHGITVREKCRLYPLLKIFDVENKKGICSSDDIRPSRKHRYFV